MEGPTENIKTTVDTTDEEVRRKLYEDLLNLFDGHTVYTVLDTLLMLVNGTVAMSSNPVVRVSTATMFAQRVVEAAKASLVNSELPSKSDVIQ